MEGLVLTKESAILGLAELHREKGKRLTNVIRCDPVLMIRNGFMPRKITALERSLLNSPPIIRYLSASKERRQNTVFKSTINFWLLNNGEHTSSGLNAFLRKYRYHPFWLYSTLAKHKQHCL